MSLEYGILGFLSDKELSGYDIKKAFDISCSFIWKADLGQIYRTLDMMLGRGLVDIESTAPGIRHDKKIYAITEAGRLELGKWLSSGIEESPMRNEALLKLFHLAKSDKKTALENLDKLIAFKKLVVAVFDQMTKARAGEYREILGLSEDSADYKINLFLSRWGYMREEAFIQYLEQYRKEFIDLK